MEMAPDVINITFKADMNSDLIDVDFIFQVLHLKTKDGYVTEITDVYAEDGTKFISGSTIAVHYRGKLLVGTVNNKAVVCEIMYLN